MAERSLHRIARLVLTIDLRERKASPSARSAAYGAWRVWRSARMALGAWYVWCMMRMTSALVLDAEVRTEKRDSQLLVGGVQSAECNVQHRCRAFHLRLSHNGAFAQAVAILNRSTHMRGTLQST